MSRFNQFLQSIIGRSYPRTAVVGSPSVPSAGRNGVDAGGIDGSCVTNREQGDGLPEKTTVLGHRQPTHRFAYGGRSGKFPPALGPELRDSAP